MQHPILVDCFLTEEDQDAAVQDLALIVNAVEARDDHAVALILERQSKTGPIRYSPERHAIQFLGCRGGVVWHVPLPSTVGIVVATDEQQ